MSLEKKNGLRVWLCLLGGFAFIVASGASVVSVVRVVDSTGPASRVIRIITLARVLN